MNDPNDVNQTQPTPEPAAEATSQPAGFCQNCGKPLNNETIRKVGAAVYCEPCLAARLSGATPDYTNVRAGGYAARGAWATENLAAPGPNPGLAALLGIVPGVGAMYNEQYAKGIVHLLVFAVLVSLASNVNGIFSLFALGWVFYMAIEAHHTARARRDGTPLPNPFGLNDIGERLGFGRSWPSGPSVADVANDAAAAAATAAAAFQARTTPPPPTSVPPVHPAQNWGAPADAYTQQFVRTTYDQAYRDAGYTAPPAQPATPYNPVPPFTPVTPFDPATLPPVQPSRFPAGAVWLIGLGVVFLLTTTGIFNSVPPEALIGAVLLGLGLWIFIRRMLETGTGLQNDGSVAYPLRLIRALRVSVYLDLIGTLFLLDGFNALRWHYSWPFLIILPGVMAIAERFAYQSAGTSFTHHAQEAPLTQPTEPTQGGN